MRPIADRILETALYADDLQRAEEFYGRLLGLSVTTRQEGRHVFFASGQGMLLIFDPRKAQEASANPDLPVPVHGAVGAGHVCFAASASEIDAWCSFFDEQNIEVEADFCWPGGGRSIYVRDPAGNSVEFAEPRIWGLK